MTILSNPSSADQTPAPRPATGFFGLDVSQDQIMVCFLRPDGTEATRRFEVPNTQPGAEALAQRMLDLAHEHGLARLLIGLEPTGLYWWHLACYLSDSPILQEMPHEVYALNPRWIKGLKQAYSDQGKSDRLDAYIIAEKLRLGRLPAPFQVDLLYAPLQRLTRFRRHLTESLSREKNYFLSLLFLKFSGFSQANPFSDTFGATSSALLEEFGTEQLAQMPLEKLATFLNRQSRSHLGDPAKVAAAIQQAARDSYRLKPQLQEPVDLVLAASMSIIRTLQSQQAAMDRTIAQHLAALPEYRRCIQSVPGLGPVLTAGLVAEIGSIERFQNEASLARFAGLVWHPQDSGSFCAEDRRMAKTGNSYLRYYLVEAANSVRQHCAEYRVYYEAKVAQSTKHAHKRALVLSARKLVRLLDGLLRDGKLYRVTEQGQQGKEVARSEPRSTHPRTPQRHRLAAIA